jgi:hypothetical protein
MSAQAQDQHPSRIVIVVGVDLSNVSEHLLEQTRTLIRPVDEAEVHVVRVVRPEPPLLRLVLVAQGTRTASRSRSDSSCTARSLKSL